MSLDEENVKAFSKSAATDESGVYRIYGIPPGNYILTYGYASGYVLETRRAALTGDLQIAVRLVSSFLNRSYGGSQWDYTDSNIIETSDGCIAAAAETIMPEAPWSLPTEPWRWHA